MEASEPKAMESTGGSANLDPEPNGPRVNNSMVSVDPRYPCDSCAPGHERWLELAALLEALNGCALWDRLGHTELYFHSLRETPSLVCVCSNPQAYERCRRTDRHRPREQEPRLAVVMPPRGLLAWLVFICACGLIEQRCGHVEYDFRASKRAGCTRLKHDQNLSCYVPQSGCFEATTLMTLSPRVVSDLAGMGGPLVHGFPFWPTAVSCPIRPTFWREPQSGTLPS